MGVAQASTRRFAPRPVLIVALVTAVCLLGDTAMYVVLPSQIEAFAISAATIGPILSINRFIRIVSNLGAGWVYQRLGFLRPFLFVILLSALTTASYGLFVGFWPLFIAHGLWGVSWSFLRLGGYLTVLEAGTRANVGRLMGLLYGVARGGSLLASLLGGALADTLGARRTFVVFGIATLGAFALVPFGHLPKQLGQKVEPAARRSEAEPPAQVGKRLITGKIAVLDVAGFAFGMVVPGLTVGTVGYLLRTIVGDDASVIGLAVGVATLTGMLISVRWTGDLGLSAVFGHLSDRAGRRRVVLAAIVTIAASLTLVAVVRELAVVLPAVSALFIAGTALTVSLDASIGELAPVHRRAMVLSQYATWVDIGSAVGPLLGYAVVTSLGFGWAYGGGGALMACAGALYLWAFRRGYRPAA